MSEQKFGAEDSLEQALDAALRSYSDVTPGPGLETRILATVRAAVERPRRRWAWLPWTAIPLALASALLVAWLFWPVQNPRSKRAPGTIAAVTTPSQVPVPKVKPTIPPKILAASRKPSAPSVESRRAEVHVARDTPAASAPKLAVFPTPIPLTEQERLLLAYMRQTPRAEIIAQSKPDEPPPPRELNELEIPGPATRKSMDTK